MISRVKCVSKILLYHVRSVPIVHQPSFRFFWYYGIRKARPIGQKAMLIVCYCFALAVKGENGPLLYSFKDLTHNRGQAHLAVVGNVCWVPLLEYWTDHCISSHAARQL